MDLEHPRAIIGKMLGCNNKVAPNPEINALGKDALPRRGTELDLAPFSLLRVNKKWGTKLCRVCTTRESWSRQEGMEIWSWPGSSAIHIELLLNCP